MYSTCIMLYLPMTDVFMLYRTIHCLLVDCGLLRHIIDIISIETASADTEGTNEAVQEIRSKSLIAGSRRPVVGHVISIAQSIVGAMQTERLDADGSIDISQDVSSENGLDDGVEQNQQSTLVKSVLSEAGLFEEWNAFVQSSLQQIMDRQSAYSNVDNADVSTDSAKLSQMEAALEALALRDSSWMRQNDDDIQNNVFDDDDDSDDDDDNSDDEDDYHNYGHSNFSSQIKVTAVIKDDVSPDRNMVDFEDDEFEIGDQFARFNDSDNNNQNFADFSTNDAPSFAANFDNVPEANFGADFESPQFDSSNTFETNFNAVGEDLFADFSSVSPTNAGVEVDPFFSTTSDLKDIDDNDTKQQTENASDMSVYNGNIKNDEDSDTGIEQVIEQEDKSDVADENDPVDEVSNSSKE